MKKLSITAIASVVLMLQSGRLTQAEWTEPALLVELNDPAGYEAKAPCLSPDGLTIYFARYVPSYADTMIVSAYRSSLQDAFANEEVLDDLHTGLTQGGPWVSTDGLRLYCHQNASGSAGRQIVMAQRQSQSDPWWVSRTFTEVYVAGYDDYQPSLTADELIMVWTSTRPSTGPSNSYQVWMADRGGPTEAFTNVRELSELGLADHAGPYISPDGLTLYFNSSGDGVHGQGIYTATRQSLGEPFGSVELVEPASTTEFDEIQPYVSDTAHQAIYFFSDRGTQLDQKGIWITQWVEPATPTTVYHIDAVDGNDNYDGLTEETAFATVQAGVNAADNGDTVLVHGGLYTDGFAFLGKAITVQGVGDAPILNVPDDYAVSFYAGEGAGSVLRNFIITGCDIGIFLVAANPTISHVTVVDNGYGIAAYSGGNPDITDSIFWANTTGDLFQCQARYSCIETSLTGQGNIDQPPLFAVVNDPCAPGQYDYHLQSRAGRYEPGDPCRGQGQWVLDAFTSPCIDAGDPTADPRAESAPNGGRANMGAYGGAEYASRSTSEWLNLSDMNHDGIVDVRDFAAFSSDWQWSAPWNQ